MCALPLALRAACLTEHHVMPGTREQRPEFAAHQSRTEIADAHGLLSRIAGASRLIGALPPCHGCDGPAASLTRSVECAGQ
jgi:hypothetical protein